MNRRRLLSGLAAAVLFPASAIDLAAQNAPSPPAWVYHLMDGSQLVDDCLICGRPTILLDLRGSFQLQFTEQNPFYSTGELRDISFEAGGAGGPHYKITGKGTYWIGGEVALRQTLYLELMIDDGYTNKLCYFTNDSAGVTRLWPMFQAQANQTNFTLIQQFTLQLNAAPFREIWFTTAGNLTAGIWNPPTNAVSSGDLLSSRGRVVRRNQQLTAQLGIQPIVPDLGLKDFDILPGGEIVFAIAQDTFSETLGPLHAGDLLSDQSRIRRTNAQLLAAFAPQAPVPDDLGLGAVQVQDSGGIYFSVQTNFFSEKLGRKIQRGDLLSDQGEIVKTASQLLSRFSPANPDGDYGLSAVYVWPSGEVWFCTADGFSSTQFGSYRRGDLLSDQGYVVYRNLELVSAFQPLEDVADFGLDGLYVISDVTPLTATAAKTALRLPGATNQPPASLALQWTGGGRVFQLERATTAAGPFSALSPITTDKLFTDPGALTNEPQSFYRLRQW